MLENKKVLTSTSLVQIRRNDAETTGVAALEAEWLQGNNSLLFIDHTEDSILAVLQRVNQRRKDISLKK